MSVQNPLHGAKGKPEGLRPKIVFSCIALNIHKLPMGSDRALVGKGVVPMELNVQKRCFMWLYVSFNFLVENAVNL